MIGRRPPLPSNPRLSQSSAHRAALSKRRTATLTLFVRLIVFPILPFWPRCRESGERSRHRVQVGVHAKRMWGCMWFCLRGTLSSESSLFTPVYNKSVFNLSDWNITCRSFQEITAWPELSFLVTGGWHFNTHQIDWLKFTVGCCV